MARKALGLDRDGVQKVMHIGDYWGGVAWPIRPQRNQQSDWTAHLFLHRQGRHCRRCSRNHAADLQDRRRLYGYHHGQYR